MAIQAAILCPTSPLGSTLAPVYTTPAQAQALVKRAVFTNTSAATVVITVHRVASGGAPGAGTQVISGHRLTANEAYTAPELSNMVLNGNDALHAVCDAANAVNVTISGFTM